jgi:hypothetical protein
MTQPSIGNRQSAIDNRRWPIYDPWMRRPARLWKDLPGEIRVRAAEAFWRDEDAPEIKLQQVEALVAIARRLNFRQKSVQAMSIERRARALAQLPDVSDALATRALVAYHFQHQRPLMAVFLDALGVAHENGLITAEDLQPPDRARLAQAVETVRASFPKDDVALYLSTLVAVDDETWKQLEGIDLDGSEAAPEARGTPLA